MENTLPRVLTPKETAEYLKVDEDVILHELETGSLKGFKIGKEWRCSEENLLAYIRGERDGVEPPEPYLVKIPMHEKAWNIVETGPFDFNWPKIGGGSNQEHYDKGYEATATINGQEYTFKIGFGNRESAGQIRRRVTIWLGNRAVVEFAGSNDYKNDGLLAGIIRLRNGKQLTTQRIPDEYRSFKVQKYNSVVQGRRASNGMAVIAHKDDFKTMLEHAVIRAIWKELI
jgi:excisionase family DNA binding protein